MKLDSFHLAYCTNVHPAETWAQTMRVLHHDVAMVRASLLENSSLTNEVPFAIGLRLSARAAAELLTGDHLTQFRDWLAQSNSYVFTINGFPYGNFHGTRVKEKVFQPDWTSPDRIAYTKNLFRILAFLTPPGNSASVSTLPGSHKSFQADETALLAHLRDFASWLDELAENHSVDFHLGLEPEPLGHFENTSETLAFFEKLGDAPEIRSRIGVNFDSCHFAIEFDHAAPSLAAFQNAGIRISKIHLSNALALDPRDPAALAKIRQFDEPTYFHQVVARDEQGNLSRFPDLADFLAAAPGAFHSARVHFHIPLDAEPSPPLRSTRFHAEETLHWCLDHPAACQHFEIETYTWAALPPDLQRPLAQQIAAEYQWALPRFRR